MTAAWLEIDRGEAPLVVSFPHTGIDIPPTLEGDFVSLWLARKDADWWIDQLYGFARNLGATTVRTRISRSVIDVNRDPSGVSLYPGQATTELCPTTTFDGEPLYRPGREPDAAEIGRRVTTWFTPYHEALDTELKRLRARHRRVVLYEAHSIRSAIPRLFDGELPQFNLGTNGGTSCHPALTAAVEAACDATRWTRITNGRFKGGWTTRRYGDPKGGVHAIQMELACRGYMDEPFTEPTPENWPPAWRADRAQPMAEALTDVLKACLTFAKT
jgi:N-formylglutamate deformylase